MEQTLTFTPELVGGGGCVENGGNWSIQVNNSEWNYFGQPFPVNVASGTQVPITFECEGTDLECGDFQTEIVIIASNYEVEPTIFKKAALILMMDLYL